MIKVGIDLINFYTPQVYLDLAELASVRQVPVEKYTVGIGQEKMSLIDPFEDIVTMAAEAAHDIVKGREQNIGLVLFATESGVDYSKSAGVYLHSLLQLNPNCRVLEVKQACFAATGALLLAKDYVTLHPDKLALVVASDVAWYGLNTPGEVTQGAGAVAMVVSVNPRLAVIEEGKAIVENSKDFYRPSYNEVPIVDGKLSIRSYKELLKQVRPDKPLKFVCFHMPFATMSDKASEVLTVPLSPETLMATKAFNKDVGNIYNGSLYLSFISLLTTYPNSLANETIGMFSYGSGATGETFFLTLQPNYEKVIDKKAFLSLVNQRRKADFSTYERLMTGYEHREKSLNFTTTIPNSKHRFVLTAIVNGHREYLKR